MKAHKRLDTAKEALTLFMRSLPEGCKFSIISFGCPKHTPLRESDPVEDYNDETRDFAIEQISQMEADFGGTNILSPLQSAQTGALYESGLKKRVFLLTDGCCNKATEIEALAKQHNESTRVFTFGLGSGCDRGLVTKVARAGRGIHTIVEDGTADLNG